MSDIPTDFRKPDMTESNTQFWLLTGEVPNGPFTASQIHVELVEGRATWQTPACCVGDGKWLSLVQMPGIGPIASPDMNTPAAVRSASPTVQTSDSLQQPESVSTFANLRSSLPAVPSFPSDDSAQRVPVAFGAAGATEDRLAAFAGIAILLVLVGCVGGAGYGLYTLFRPLTPTEVCMKLDEAKTVAEAKKYVTVRMQPLVEDMAKNQSFDPNDESEFTREIDGVGSDTKLVGFKMNVFILEAGRRARMEGHMKLIKSGGWKVDDIVISGVEGEQLPGPVSLVDEQRRSATPSGPKSGPGAWPIKSDAPVIASKPQQDLKGQIGAIVSVVSKIKDTIGWGGIIVIVVVIVIVIFIQQGPQKKKPTASRDSHRL